MKLSTLITSASVVISSVAASNGDATSYFAAELAADPAAVPSSGGSKSTGKATFAVKPSGEVLMDIAWEIVGEDGPIDEENALIGIHIHSGDSGANGPIVFGFCGQDPLPPFGGYCQQGWSSGSAQVATQYAGKICDMAPPAPCYEDGGSTAAEAAEALIKGAPMYVNIHSTKSLKANGDAGPLGLIRGQLMPECNRGTVTSVSTEMTSDDGEDVTMPRRKRRSEQHQIQIGYLMKAKSL